MIYNMDEMSNGLYPWLVHGWLARWYVDDGTMDKFDSIAAGAVVEFFMIEAHFHTWMLSILSQGLGVHVRNPRASR